MLRSLAHGKFAIALMLLALPLTATGCRTGGSGWGLSPWSSTSMPSMSSWNPWKSSDSSLASSKPSQIPTPPAAMLAGSGMARNSQSNNNQTGAPTYNANTFAGNRPTGGYTASANDYGTRQVSATGGDGYYTGPYSTGGNAAAQQGPYGAGGSPGFYNGAATADRRSDAAYGAGNPSGYQGNTQSPASAPTYNNSYPSTPSGQGYPSTGSAPYGGAQSSPYSGSTGSSAGGRNSLGSSSTPAYASGEAYRPGSTGRASADVQRTSYDNQAASSGETGADYGGSYPTTAANDDSAYR